MSNAADLLIKNIKFFLKKNEMSQVDLAKSLGVAANTVSQWMVRNRDPEMEQISKLAEAFQIEPHELFIDYTKLFIDHNKLNKSESPEMTKAIRLLKSLDQNRFSAVLQLLETMENSSAQSLKKTE